MKILILSDSHGCVEAMETVVAREKPQAMVHLGDLWADGKQLGKLFQTSHCIRWRNCDRYGWEPGQDQIRTVSLDHVVIYMTHGHLHGVKLSLLRLRLAAKEAGAQVALFGHPSELLPEPGGCATDQSGSLRRVQQDPCRPGDGAWRAHL